MKHCASLAAYGFLGLPLAMVALPVYVQVPQYYTGQVGLSLALTGWVLFAARLIDTVQDPWLGLWIDRLAKHQRLGGVLVGAALIFMVVFGALWLPVFSGQVALALWLGLTLALVYTLHSFINIAYLSWGARLGRSAAITRAAGWREAAGLVGVILASAGPVWLSQREGWSAREAMAAYSGLFAFLLVTGIACLLKYAPGWNTQADNSATSLRQAWNTEAFRTLLVPFTLNAIAVAVPATLALFFITDKLQASAHSGMFLASYFLAGAVGLPAWTHLAQRIGAVRAWRAGMVLAVVAFIWAIGLGAGDSLAYLVVCLMAGLALGADLAMPPVVLAGLIPPGQTPAGYYGIWSLLGKLALAVSGLLLPLLASVGYEPGNTHSNVQALGLVYAGVPCALKLLAWISLRPLAGKTHTE
jgi:Na+/melibiose symporter-like transporter